ncbi:MAG: DUF1176 domain-containing protein [Sphingomonas sp.]|uniref:DUF1176 domain-containing protein n=1 Tax=Sphingomonas sp. TaxID=28214 RepID=UPI0025D2BDEB|nr:DUF1176 domain-containing protein [Sphingomonas sp.]MBX3565790.1 DUF1176 domain-containing protein [Sphingomonas sp.]
MLNLLLLFAAFADAPQAEVFDDWAAACDNVKRCEATALQAPEQFGDDPSQVLMTREADGTLSIAIDPATLVKGPVTLLVDGKQVATGTIGENYRVSGPAADALAKSMAAGKWLELRNGARAMAKISLDGFSAALDYIVAEQRGGASALPVVPALRAASGAADSPSKAVLGEMAKLGDCDLSAVAKDLPVERYRLDATTTLVLIPCGSGAYNYNSAAFVLRGGKGAPAEFDVMPDWMDGDGPGVLTNASFATIDGAVLTSSQKGRGLGDCGSSQSWVWDGSRFRMIEARSLGECRGSVNWLTVFRATPQWR